VIIWDFVPFHEVAQEIAMNLDRHYEDVDQKDDYGPPNLDWELYIEQSLAGQCLAIVARDKAKLVGYSVFFVGGNANHKGIKEATNTGIFIDKAYRGKITGALLKKTDEYLSRIGVNEASYLLSDDRIGKLLERNRYAVTHKQWSRRYDKE